ncbi:hypothetical protein JCM11251_000522 [Rhodosporidiobolus azoricus]
MDSLPPPRLDLLVHSPSHHAYSPVLSQLLEPSPPLSALLAPQLHQTIAALPSSEKPKDYHAFLQIAQEVVDKWDIEDQAAFLAAHPRIGETKGLSKSSEGEQAPAAGQGATPGIVLKRLENLNSLYESAFPGLRYITFVNGRTRAEIIPELEGLLSLPLPPPSPDSAEPKLGELRTNLRVYPTGSGPWRTELKRGLQAMWDIAHSRVDKW